MKPQQLKQLIREEIKNITKSLTEGKYDADLDKIEAAVKNASSFMNVGAELKKAGIKYDFSTSMIPMYTVKVSGNTIAIVNKKYVDDAEREVNNIAIGLLEGVNESVIKEFFSKSINEAVDMAELEFELKRIKKENPGKKVTYFFTKDDPKGYKIQIKEFFSKPLEEASSTEKFLRKLGWAGEDWTPQEFASQIKKLSDSTLISWAKSNKGIGKGIPNTPLAFQQKLVKIEMDKRGLSLDEVQEKYYVEPSKKGFSVLRNGNEITSFDTEEEAKQHANKLNKMKFLSKKKFNENFIGAALVKKSGMVKDLDSLEKEPIYVKDVLPIYRKEGSSYVVKSSLTGNALKVPAANLIVKMKDQFEPDKWAKFMAKVSRY